MTEPSQPSITNGWYALAPLTPSPHSQVFNLGNNNPEELMRFISVMEKTLKKTAEVKVNT